MPGDRLFYRIIFDLFNFIFCGFSKKKKGYYFLRKGRKMPKKCLKSKSKVFNLFLHGENISSFFICIFIQKKWENQYFVDNFWPKIVLFRTILAFFLPGTIFGQHFDFWSNFLFLTKISMFDPNFDFRLKFRILAKFGFLTKILILVNFSIFDRFF